MKTFSSFVSTLKSPEVILEDLSGVTDKSHYTHIEDTLFIYGSRAIEKIMITVVETVKGIPTTTVQAKIDGSPSVFYGYKDGKFFVATKSIFNKNPKINYTEADIERNHGHASGLVTKLKESLMYLPEITPTTTTSIYQGDFMFSQGDIWSKDISGVDSYLFKPNTIINAIPKTSDLGRKISRAKIGFAPHTKYSSVGMRIPLNSSDIKTSSNVFVMPVHAPLLRSYKELDSSIKHVRSILESTSKAGLEFMSSDDISPLALAAVNAAVKNKEKFSFGVLVNYIRSKFEKEIAETKSVDLKAAKAKNMDALLSQIYTKRSAIESVINAHTEVSNFKDNIISLLDKEQPIKRFLPGELDMIPVGPEGYVAYNKTGTSKLVNRGVFSLANFTNNSKKTAISEERDRIAVIVPLGRFNPPHKEHLNLINAVLQKAKQVGGKPIIFVSTTYDKIKNPIKVKDKIDILNKMVPGNRGLFVPGKTLFDVLKSLDGQYDSIIMVLGDDRVEDIHRIEKYNGQEYHFKNISTVSRHSIIDTRQSGSDGVHASDVRRWAHEGDFVNVRKAMPSTLNDADVRNIMRLINN